MFCSVKSDEGNDAVPHLSLRELNTFACSLRQVPMRSMQHVLVGNKKRLALASRDHKRGVSERFFPFILHACECCMAKLNMCALLKIAARY